MIDEPFESFEKRWKKLTRRFTWKLPGMDEEDVRQELRVALFKAYESFDSSKGKLNTYLWRALSNTVGNLRAKTQRRKRSSTVEVVPLDSVLGKRGEPSYRVQFTADLDLDNLLAKAPQAAKKLAKLIISDESKATIEQKLTRRELEQGKAYLRAALQERRDEQR